MDILRWRTSYEIGIASMDAQHQQLIDLVNQAYRIITKKEGDDTLEEILEKMAGYAEKHLSDEEALLRHHNFPDLDEHLSEHANYRAEIEMLVSALATDRQWAVQEIYTFLRSWWLNHIVIRDKEYGPFLKEKGV